MASTDELNKGQGHTRRTFLARLSIGLATIAGTGFLLKNLFLPREDRASTSNYEFPGEESIFHPRKDPRLEAQERQKNT